MITVASPANPIFPELLPAHPRLLATTEDWSRLKKLVESDPNAARIFEALRNAGDYFLTQPSLDRVMTGRRLLHVSRAALERITTLALVANVTGEKKYADRAIAELTKVAEFSDWNPTHYLDTAEMALAVAIGYDWLYSNLREDQRQTLGRILIEKGIQPSFTDPEPGWVKGRNNWNQVCNAGLSAAAIATAELDPVLAEKVIQRAIGGLPSAAHSYAPDGAYVEGTMYWNYGTSFHVVLAAALERLTGSAQGIEKYPGFAESADYVNQLLTPSGRFWAYSDNIAGRQLQIPLFWFAKKFEKPELLTHEIGQLDDFLDKFEKGNFADISYRLLALSLLWYHPSLATEKATASDPQLSYFRGEMPVVVFKSGQVPGFFAGIKGGSPSLSHAHMDEGSFYIESDGVVWATDFGLQDYNSLESVKVNMWQGSQEGQRWKIFRFGPDAHSILRFDGKLQRVEGKAEFTKVQPEGSQPFCVLDLSPIYKEQAEKVQRGMKLVDGQSILLQDEWVAPAASPIEATWQWLTTTEVTVDSNAFRLKQAGKGLMVRVLEPSEAKIEVQPVADLLQWYDAPNPKAKRIVIRVSTKAGSIGRLRVLVMFDSTPIALPKLENAIDLDAW